MLAMCFNSPDGPPLMKGNLLTTPRNPYIGGYAVKDTFSGSIGSLVDMVCWYLVGGLEHFLFFPILGTIIPFDQCFSEELKPPTRLCWYGSPVCVFVCWFVCLCQSFWQQAWQRDWRLTCTTDNRHGLYIYRSTGWLGSKSHIGRLTHRSL